MSEIETVEQRVVYENDFVTVRADRVRFASGKTSTYAHMMPTRPGPGVVVVAIHGGLIALVKTYRYPLQEFQWGLPRGFSHGDDPLQTARAELLEELGAVVSDCAILGQMTPDSGLLGQRVAVVRAVVDAVGERTDEDEVAAVAWVPLDELMGRVVRGEIEDSFTLSALLLHVQTPA